MSRLMTRGKRAALAIGAVLTGCSFGPQTDTDSPTVRITAPGAGATVSGAVVFSADASDSFGVDAVRFFIDGVQVTEDRNSPYETTWNTLGGATDGSHVLRVEAVDVSGNKSGAEINVTVANEKQ